MSKVEIKRPFPGKDSGKCYQASLVVVEKAGYQIFKKREIASLVICEGSIDGRPVSLSITVPFGFPTSIVVALASEDSGEDVLNTEANRLFSLLEAELQH